MSFYVVPEYGRRLGTAEAGSLLVRNIKKPAMAPPRRRDPQQVVG